MDKNRHNEWVEASWKLQFIDVYLINMAQGLGVLDIDLLEEFPTLDMNSKTDEDKLKKLRHLTISELWVLGAFELIRKIDEICNRKNQEGNYVLQIDEDIRRKIKDILAVFHKIRVPLAKFERPSKNEHMLYSQIPTSFWDNNGVGWNIYSTHPKDKLEAGKFYRKDLANSLLGLLKQMGS